MAKRNKQTAETTATVVDAKPPRKQYVLHVVEGATFKAGTARAEWYARLCAHNGKTLEEFTASCVANPPSTPNKGKLTGMLEPVGGWVSFFKGGKKGAEKLLTLVEQQ